MASIAGEFGAHEDMSKSGRRRASCGHKDSLQRDTVSSGSGSANALFLFFIDDQ